MKTPKEPILLHSKNKDRSFFTKKLLECPNLSKDYCCRKSFLSIDFRIAV